MHALKPDLVFADRGFEEVSAAMRPTADERQRIVRRIRRTSLEDVVDAARLCLEQSLEALEKLADEFRRVAAREFVEHVITIGDEREEVALLADLLHSVDT